jgi:hypothetical protein
LGHEGTDWLWLWELDKDRWVVVWEVGGGNWLMSSSWGHVSTFIRGWGGSLVVVVVGVVRWGWVVTETVLSSGSVTGGGVWSSGNWVGVVVRDISWLILEAWGTGWSILWSVGSGAWWGNAVDTERSVVSVALWESSSGGVSLVWGDVGLSRDIRDHGGEKGEGGVFHFV